MIHKIIRMRIFALTLLVLLACAACTGNDPTPQPTAVSPTSIPTKIPPTIMPTAVSTTAVDTTAVPISKTSDGLIIYGQTVEGSVSKNGRSQWQFDADKSDTLYITVTPLEGSFDAIVDVVGQDGRSILEHGEVDNYFGEEKVETAVPASGTYYIIIRNFAATDGKYQLWMDTQPDIPASSGHGDGAISQWSSRAIASSEFSTNSWSASQAEGAPDTFICGDNKTAWAAANSSTVEWIELRYETDVRVTGINIYQNFNPDQVVTVELIAANGEIVPVYTQTQVAEESCPYILSLSVESNFASNGVRITIDQSALGDWTEIDAVELIGIPMDDALPVPVGSESSPSSPAVPIDGSILWRIGGEAGYDDEQFGHFEAVAYDPIRHTIYAANTDDGIILLNESGEQIDIFKHGSFYFNPKDVALDGDGNVYVANGSLGDDNGRIIVFSPDGEIIHEYGYKGTEDGSFGILSPDSIAVAADGTTYALDSNESSDGAIIYRVQKFSKDGTLEAVFPISTKNFAVSYDSPMAVGSDGSLYIADWLNSTILKMDADGTIINLIERDVDLYAGRQDGITIDAEDNIYLTVWDEPAIVKINQEGDRITSYGLHAETEEGSWPSDHFYWPNGIAVSPDGDTVYVTDWSGDYTYLTAVDMRR